MRKLITLFAVLFLYGNAVAEQESFTVNSIEEVESADRLVLTGNLKVKLWGIYGVDVEKARNFVKEWKGYIVLAAESTGNRRLYSMDKLECNVKGYEGEYVVAECALIYPFFKNSANGLSVEYKVLELNTLFVGLGIAIDCPGISGGKYSPVERPEARPDNRDLPPACRPGILVDRGAYRLYG